ncbi:hypothetical protein QVD17_09672 [Tagetes erecta]|uniref:Uncharacterized protein n=1 Tax=Tagetes erecta TaxID=13708 RepID=A0AAD8L119_TARER|nr:hypothetical protein QVD17_09672 [Tagetes erecta]
MQNSGETNNIGFSPSFNCYSDVNQTSNAATKVSSEVKEEHAAEFQEFSDIDEEDFEFSFEFSREKFSTNELASEGRILLPIFNTDLVTKDDLDVDHNDSSAVIPLAELLQNDSEKIPLSSSSSEVEESKDTDVSSGMFCVSWRKCETKSPAQIKKSKSTGFEQSGSRRWKIKDIIRRSNSLGKETIFFLCPKKVKAARKTRPKLTRKSMMGSSPSIHEMFYVQKRTEKEKEGKMKSYLPYKQDILVLGFKVHINGNSNKKLPF